MDSRFLKFWKWLRESKNVEYRQEQNNVSEFKKWQYKDDYFTDCSTPNGCGWLLSGRGFGIILRGRSVKVLLLFHIVRLVLWWCCWLFSFCLVTVFLYLGIYLDILCCSIFFHVLFILIYLLKSILILIYSLGVDSKICNFSLQKLHLIF